MLRAFPPRRRLCAKGTKPAAANFLQQQARVDAFVERFNHERPRHALGMRVPSGLYARCPRPYRRNALDVR